MQIKPRRSPQEQNRARGEGHDTKTHRKPHRGAQGAHRARQRNRHRHGRRMEPIHLYRTDKPQTQTQDTVKRDHRHRRTGSETAKPRKHRTNRRQRQKTSLNLLAERVGEKARFPHLRPTWAQKQPETRSISPTSAPLGVAKCAAVR